MLAICFEDLWMEDNETIIDINSKLCVISNEWSVIGEKYPWSKLVKKKTLKFLPNKYTYKVTEIEEARDINMCFN